MSGRPHAIRARGDSMFPLIPDGTLLLVHPEKPIRLGDVVVARLPGGGLVAHRVLALEGMGVRLRGDNNPRADEPISCSDVMGSVVLMLRKGQEVRPDALWFRLLTRAVVLVMRRIRG